MGRSCMPHKFLAYAAVKKHSMDQEAGHRMFNSFLLLMLTDRPIIFRGTGKPALLPPAAASGMYNIAIIYYIGLVFYIC